ncbi:hypothetical protein [Legionella spiritensis]|uniref:hypothetical protein n=1 Tax=Legionella spiritensis TaxID=452 RepID=UPI000F6DB32E|nr:hypothetical protein [Legionella spiritensis]VEG89914.1 Uncharacterised protein [Legionella spiritensis]
MFKFIYIVPRNSNCYTENQGGTGKQFVIPGSLLNRENCVEFGQAWCKQEGSEESEARIVQIYLSEEQYKALKHQSTYIDETSLNKILTENNKAKLGNPPPLKHIAAKFLADRSDFFKTIKSRATGDAIELVEEINNRRCL